MIRVANAPCSYGAFELTVGVIPNVPEPEDVLAAMASAGYEGTELGPPRYLGDGETLHGRLERFGLRLAGGFIQIRFGEVEHLDEDLAAMAATLDLFEAADGSEARAVLADARRLEDADWSQLAEGVARAAELARGRGFEPTFHHHAGTSVETPPEIERLLELTDVGLLLDTGHLVLAGGDPAQGFRDWRDRINHVHVKDVRLDVLRGAADMADAWRRGVFCELGSGDVDLVGFFAALDESGYAGSWLVVEQDWVPARGDAPRKAFEAQARNRRWLRAHAGL